MARKETKVKRKQSIEKGYFNVKHEVCYLCVSALVSFFFLPFFLQLPFTDLNVGTFLGQDLDPVFWYVIIFFSLWFIFYLRKRKIANRIAREKYHRD